MYFSTNRWGRSKVATCNHKADGPFHLLISIDYNMVIYNNKYCQQNQLSLNIINSNSTWLFSAVFILNNFTFVLSCIIFEAFRVITKETDMNETNLLTIQYYENTCHTQSCYKLLSSYTSNLWFIWRIDR